jgi:glycerophosphoryl diester phosphodiesterase
MLIHKFPARQPTTKRRRPLVIAHRGAAGLAPENTLAAFRLALHHGADGVEMDVRLTADGHPVVIHDARVNRTTNGTGVVSGLTLREVQTLDAGSWFARRLIKARSMKRRRSTDSITSEPPPTLKAALLLLSRAGVERIYIELKADQVDGQLLGRVVSMIREMRVERSVTLLSFDHAVVRRAKEIAPGIRTAATFPAKGRRLSTTHTMIRAAENAGVDEVALHFGLATRRSVAAFHETGFSVSVWTANSKLSMRRLVACGVDSIMTDFPDRLRELLDSPTRK